ncbi:MAG: response regulator [Chloroflexi bacterium]|nr:response regulator [Chloroflexota bacterium]
MTNTGTHTILIIDADPSSRSYLATALTSSQYDVLVAASGREGLVLAWQNLPAIIVVDPILPDMGSSELVAKLRHDRRTQAVPCIAIASGIHQEAVNSLLEAGFTEFLDKSSQTVDRLLALIPRILSNQVQRNAGGIVIAFLSAKGGTGTSSLCANLANITAAQSPNNSLVVVDLVLPIGSIADLAGQSARETNLAAATTRLSNTPNASFIQDNLLKAPRWNFWLLPGTPDPQTANTLEVARIPELLAVLRDSFDFVFVDLGRSLSHFSMAVLTCAEVVVPILSADAITASHTRTVLDFLTKQGVEGQRFHPILNRAVGLEGLTRSQVEEKIGRPIQHTIPYMGGNFTVANNQCEPLAGKFPTDAATLALQQAARNIVDLGRQLREK